MEELVEMEKVMNVYEEVVPGDEFVEKHAQLVRVDRHFVGTEVLDIKQAPFSSSKKVPARIYLFQDLMIVAVPSGSGTPESIGSMLDTEDAGRRRTLKRYSNKYKVLSWLDLSRCSIKLTDPRVIQVTFVTRHMEQRRPGGTERILTRVEKIELWTSEEAATRLYTQMTCFLEELIEQDLRRSSIGSAAETVSMVSSSGESVSASPPPAADGDMQRTRSWASRKANLRRNGTLKSKKDRTLPRRNGSATSAAAGGDDSMSMGGLSLSDIESRYQLNLDAPALPDGSVEFIVEYGEGMMGFSLSSGSGVGVIVGRIAEGSFSAEAGVCIGDRVVEVDGQAISLDTRWQDVVETIKHKRRPLRVKFERFAGRVKEQDDASSQVSKGTLKRRQWAKKKQQRAHATVEGDERLISLSEMEKLYRQGKSSENQDTFVQIADMFSAIKGPDESQPLAKTVSVLQEIWATERTYVLDLRALVREFIIPLRRKVKRAKCKDSEGSRICEHNQLRSQCSKTSITSDSLLSNTDMRTIFVNIETLVKINTELLSFLEQELVHMDRTTKVPEIAKVYGPAFEKVMPFFKLYALYCHQYPTAIDRLLVCRTQSAELDAVLKEREKKAKVSLNSLLIKPVQRICKYPLLFRELLKHMGSLNMSGIDEHIAELEHAAKVVQDLANDVNHIVGQSEASETLMDVFNELGGEAVVPDLITPSRKFVSRTNVLLHEPPYTSEAKLHVMFLCNDLILFGKGKEVTGFGSAKQPLPARKTRGVSLKRAFGNSLKKSLRSSVRNPPPAAAPRHTSGHRSGRGTRSGTLGKAAIKLVKTIELKGVTPRLLPDKDDQDCYGLELKFVEREFETPGKSSKPGTGKQVTKINKLQIWLPTLPEAQAVTDTLTEHINVLKAQQEGHMRAHKTVGRAKATRNWRAGRKSGSAAVRVPSRR